MFIRLLLLSLILIVLGQTPLIEPVREASAKVTNPLQYGTYRFSQNLKREFDFFWNLRRLRIENLRLSGRVVELESQLASLKELKRENQVLREQLGVRGNEERPELILSQIVGRSLGSGRATLIINRGRRAGVLEEAPVVFKNFLLGEVFAVEPERAQVRLLTDPQFSAAALDQDSPERTRGLVEGEYGTTAVLKRVLPTESLAVGDTIITSGEDGKFPKGLILGRVQKVRGQEAEVFKEAKLELLVDLGGLESVFVLR